MTYSADIEARSAQVVAAREKAWQLYQSEEGWTEVPTNMGGAVLEWRPAEPGDTDREDGVSPSLGWRCWRVRATVEASKETVVDVLMDYDKMAEWNSAVTKTKILARPSQELMLTYQVTSGQRPVVTPRDFVYLLSITERDGAWFGGGCSISLDSFPPSSEYVRAWQYPTGTIVRPLSSSSSQFCWLLQTDFGGSLPPSLLNLAMPYAIKLFVTSLRKRVKYVLSKR